MTMFQKLTKFIKFKRFCSLNKTKISTKFNREIKFQSRRFERQLFIEAILSNKYILKNAMRLPDDVKV